MKPMPGIHGWRGRMGAGILVALWSTAALAQPFPRGLIGCIQDGDECREDLARCDAEVEECAAALQECESRVCRDAQLLRSGQNRTVVAGEDGNPAFGVPLSYTDTGLTVIDENTGLEWEKKTTNAGSGKNAADPNDVDNTYPWRGSCSVSGAECGTDVDCSAEESCDTGDGQTVSPNGLTIFEWVAELNSVKFAGHDDWRIPNVRELQSIVDYGRPPPSVDPTFGSTFPSLYWSSTAFARSTDEIFSWVVWFTEGYVDGDRKTNFRFVRAVRGGGDDPSAQ